MKDGQPSYDQMCRIIGAIYADAYLRIEFLENENRQLRQDQHTNVASLSASLDSLREERDKLKAQLEAKQKWNNGNGNSMLPESLLERLESGSMTPPFTSSPPQENNDSLPPKSTGTPVGTPS